MVHTKLKGELKHRPHADTVIAGQVEQHILKHAPMARGEDEAATVVPIGVLGVVQHDFVIEDVAHGRAPHGHPHVARVGLLHGINGQEADRVHRPLKQLAGGSLTLSCWPVAVSLSGASVETAHVTRLRFEEATYALWFWSDMR